MATLGTLDIIIKAKDEFTKELNKIKTGAQKFGTAAQVFIGNVATQAFNKVGESIVDSVQKAAEFTPIAEQFNALIGDQTTVLKDLKEATKGQVSELDLMRSANQAMLLGIKPEALAELAEQARILGKAVGRDATEAFNDISVGIGRQSRLILDNIGLVVDTQKAYEDYAEELGKTADELTEAEKKQGFLNETLEIAREKTSNMAEPTRTAADRWKEFTATLDDFKTELGTEILESGIMEDVMDLLKGFIPILKEDLIPIFKDFIGWINTLKDALSGDFQQQLGAVLSIVGIGGLGILGGILGAPLGPAGMALGAAGGIAAGVGLSQAIINVTQNNQIASDVDIEDMTQTTQDAIQNALNNAGG